jgi:hypothetical protein
VHTAHTPGPAVLAFFFFGSYMSVIGLALLCALNGVFNIAVRMCPLKNVFSTECYRICFL